MGAHIQVSSTQQSILDLLAKNTNGLTFDKLYALVGQGRSFDNLEMQLRGLARLKMVKVVSQRFMLMGPKKVAPKYVPPKAKVLVPRKLPVIKVVRPDDVSEKLTFLMELKGRIGASVELDAMIIDYQSFEKAGARK